MYTTGTWSVVWALDAKTGKLVWQKNYNVQMKMRMAFGCFLFCTREAFDAVGGFDPAIYATEEVTMSLALHRQGRFACLRECVSTSGRKLRTHSTVEWFIQIYRITFARQRYIRDRAAMGVWYGERRPDPELTKR